MLRSLPEEERDVAVQRIHAGEPAKAVLPAAPSGAVRMARTLARALGVRHRERGEDLLSRLPRLLAALGQRDLVDNDQAEALWAAYQEGYKGAETLPQQQLPLKKPAPAQKPSPVPPLQAALDALGTAVELLKGPLQTDARGLYHQVQQLLFRAQHPAPKWKTDGCPNEDECERRILACLTWERQAHGEEAVLCRLDLAQAVGYYQGDDQPFARVLARLQKRGAVEPYCPEGGSQNDRGWRLVET